MRCPNRLLCIPRFYSLQDTHTPPTFPDPPSQVTSVQFHYWLRALSLLSECEAHFETLQQASAADQLPGALSLALDTIYRVLTVVQVY